ncbi:MAG: SRPBCC domain-containing protein [Thermoproteota archaeon]|nr:SRPBCC domain-containing protein [Thermoproteota archaeon]
MTKIQTEIIINAPIGEVFKYYTNPDNIKQSWPSDIIKESGNISGQSNEEGAEVKVEGQYMGKREEMIIEVAQKEPNKRLVTRQTEGPFQSWESIQEFQSNGDKATLVNHVINYQLPKTGKIVNFLTGSQAEDKLRQGIEQAAQTVKQKLESP